MTAVDEEKEKEKEIKKEVADKPISSEPPRVGICVYITSIPWFSAGILKCRRVACGLEAASLKPPCSKTKDAKHIGDQPFHFPGDIITPKC